MHTDPLLGTVIDGRYQITSRLARGGMANVYRAVDTRLERNVAVKIIHSHLAEQPDFVDRFIREARSAARLSSRNIVSVYDQGVADTPAGQLPYLVMELITGSDLRTQLNELGSLPLGVALEVTRQVLQALAIAHQDNLIHRDVKPENVLLTKNLSTTSVLNAPLVDARVADFGLARAASGGTTTQTSTLLGTVAYVAPELITEGSASPAADIYSTGIMLYELISGELPFAGETPMQVAYKHVNATMPRLSDAAPWMPASIDSLIGLFTAKSPLKRPRDGAAALDALDDVIATIPEDLAIKRVPVIPQARTSARTLDAHGSTEATPATRALPLAPTIPEQLPRAQSLQTAPERGPAKPKKRAKWISFLLALLAIAGISYGTYWYFNDGPGMRVAITDVTGQDVATARRVLEDAGFTITEERAFSDDVAADIVISTDPDAGSRIHPDTPVTVVVSDGVEQVQVPQVVGEDADAAEQVLTEGRLATSIEESYSETVAEGLVISQSPEAGATVDHDSTVNLVISKGREPIIIPDMTGASQDEALGALADAGFEADVTEEYSDDVAAGLVIAQAPSSGTGYRGDIVSLTVSLGPELIAVPNVVGMQRSEATETLETAGFVVNYDEFLGGYFGTVRLQDPPAGEMVRKGSTITITIV